MFSNSKKRKRRYKTKLLESQCFLFELNVKYRLLIKISTGKYALKQVGVWHKFDLGTFNGFFQNDWGVSTFSF